MDVVALVRNGERVENQQELSLRDLFALIRRGLIFALAVAIGAEVHPK